jgi:hypothetical protein
MSDASGSAAPEADRRPLHGRFQRRSERYGFLLVLLFVDVIILFTVPTGNWWAFLGTPFVAATLLLGLYTTRVRRRALIAAWIAAFAAIGVALVDALLGTSTGQGVSYLLMTLLIVTTPMLILRRLLSHERATVQTILGAVCVYVLIGLVFAFLFVGVNGVSAQPFLAQGPNDQPETYVYLSYITLATVGYGDYTPAGSVPRALCSLEAILGQIFLVTTVARLVSLYGATGSATPNDGQEGGGGG